MQRLRVAPEKADFRPALPLHLLPGLNGTTMPKMTYADQLLHPNWQRKRLEVLERADFSCEKCSDTETTLHVHHKRYVKGRMAWEYDVGELVALCKTCHAQDHEDAEIRAELLARLAPDGPLGVDDFMAHGAGAAAHWLAEDPLWELLDYYRDRMPFQFWSGRVCQRFESLNIKSDDLEKLSTSVFDRPEFREELSALLAKYGVGVDA